MTFLFRLMCGRWASWALILTGLLTATGLAATANAQPQVQGSPIRSLLENGKGRLLWIYDGIRHVELPLADGKAVIGLSCERQTWTLFRIERNGREVYSFRNDPNWGYQPAGPIASSRLCTDAVRVAE
jgi:hypothetical protein